MASKLNYRIWIAMAISLISLQFVRAQEIESPIFPEVIDTLNGKIENAKSDIDLLKRLRITGYMQAQWQLTDTLGAATGFSGGAFPKYSDNRFAVRRGRIKFTYENEFSTYVLQLDGTEKGVAIKDAYIAVREPWVQYVTFTAGVFDRPFGYEINYSSSARETPERSRIFQTLFPGERDLGAKITLQPRKGTRFDFIKLDAGLFAGNGINSEFDSKKDFIGHLAIAKSNREENFKFGLGVSYYNGGVFQGTNVVYSMKTLAEGTNGFVADSSKSNKYNFADRTYMGVDAQFNLLSPLGITTLRGEYLWGTQPGSSDKQLDADGKELPVTGNVSLATGTAPLVDTYIRDFSGGYVYLIQSIGQSKFQVVVKYDWMDPNTKVSGTEIAKKAGSASTYMTKADIAYQTIGFGLNFRLNSQVKLTAYNEIVTNEKTGISGTNSINNYTKDLKDNVFTLRMQYKF
jgi:hypothetical protein